MVRGVAQLVARYVRDVEAGSSSLLTPTKKKEMPSGVSFFCPHLTEKVYFCAPVQGCMTTHPMDGKMIVNE